MRRLLLIPIVHSAADMGDAGVALAGKSAALAGVRRWGLHQRTVEGFWNSATAYLNRFDAQLLKVYQDGLPADGQVGMRIVEEAARRGSRNYMVVLDLLSKGAELRRTEDLVLLWHERENLLTMMQPDRPTATDAELYQSRRDQLLRERDRHIAQTISSTLKEGEIGVLFIGAHHNVAPSLANDISVEMHWMPERVRAYFKELFQGHDDSLLKERAEYLRSGDTTAKAR